MFHFYGGAFRLPVASFELYQEPVSLCVNMLSRLMSVLLLQILLLLVTFMYTSVELVLMSGFHASPVQHQSFPSCLPLRTPSTLWNRSANSEPSLSPAMVSAAMMWSGAQGAQQMFACSLPSAASNNCTCGMFQQRAMVLDSIVICVAIQMCTQCFSLRL